MDYRSDIKLEAADLDLGETKRVVCPACRGGTAQERSLSITLSDDGTLLWQCFRAKCDLGSGTNATTNHRPKSEPLVKPKKKFEGKVMELDDYYREWILKNWGIAEPMHWWYTPEYGGRIAMSVRSPKYTHRGWVLRDIKGTAHTKALTYLDDNEESLSWYKVDRTAPTVVVEDIPSAIRAAGHGVNAVALLGTSMGIDKAIEIASNAHSVILALDNDAVGLSFKHLKRYSLLWESVSILPLSKDLKDMTEEELKELLQC